MGGPGAPAAGESGVYTWVDGDGDLADVLYIGEAKNLRDRISGELAWTREFENPESTGCGLSAVLAAYPRRTVHNWPVSPATRVHIQIALIRLSAMTGGTPPAQGAGFNYPRRRTDTEKEVYRLLDEWFHDAVFAAYADQDRGRDPDNGEPPSS